MVSEAVVLTSWGDAKVGTAANVVMLLAAGYGYHLSPLVADHMLRSGAVGQPRVVDLRATINGRSRSGPGKAWMPFTEEQVNTYGRHPRRFSSSGPSGLGCPPMSCTSTTAAWARCPVIVVRAR